VLPVNDAPAAADSTLQVIETNSIVFTPEDFGFTDPFDQHGLKSVTITSVPLSGNLQLNNSGVS